MSLLLAKFLLLLAAPQTYAEQSLRQKHELILPERITIGASDNFQAVPSADEARIYHSGSSNLAVRLYVQDTAQGFTKPLLDERFDSKDPALSPSGERMLFTHFGRDSRGDICAFELKDKKIRCFSNRTTEDQQGFWIDEERIGFLTRKGMDEDFSLALVLWTP